jgi:hypothetical protein
VERCQPFESDLLSTCCGALWTSVHAGGNKRDFYGSDLWVLKYLHGFKWHHLTEKIGAWQGAAMRALLHTARRRCHSLHGGHRVGTEVQRQAAGRVDCICEA